MIFLLAAKSAFAYSIAGYGLPGIGGGFAGPAGEGALGIPYNPAATVVSNPHIVVDLAPNLTGISQHLDSWDEPVATGTSWTPPVPTLGVAAPLGPISIGASVFAPYVRMANGDPEGPQRYHSISAQLLVVEENLSVGISPIPELKLGAALRLGQVRFQSERAFDTGAMLQTLTGDTKIPLQDPFLEGRQTIHPVQTSMTSWAIGASFQKEGWGAHLGYRAAWDANLAGDVTIIPSNDVKTEVTANFETALPFPAQLYGALEIPLGDATVVPEFGWIGWSRTGISRVQQYNIELVAQDPLLATVFKKQGLYEEELIPEGETLGDQGFKDVLNLGGTVRYGPGKVTWMGGVFWQPEAVLAETAHPGSLDFGVVDLRGGARVEASKRIRLYGSIDAYVGGTRTITQSYVNPTESTNPSLQYPDPRGEYKLSMTRVGLTTEIRMGKVD